MGFVRTLKKYFRKWKFVVYVVTCILIVQVLITLNSNPNLLEEEQLRRMKQLRLQRQHQAVNELLQGEKPLRDQDILNPKDPRFRELFLKHAGTGIGIIEDGNLQKLEWNPVSDRIPNGMDVEPSIDENFKFRPVCEVTLKDAQSAITRAKSDQCKQEIADTACKMQDKTLFPESMPRTCPHPNKFSSEAPMPSFFDENLPRVRICYMMVVHGRSFRQFRRLLRVIYHRNHYYYIHVDKRSDFLYREIVKETRQYPNVKVAHWRMATIWGGSSLLQMLLRAISDVTFLWKNWDFFVNLSALDFPIENDEKLINFLSTYRSKNFMKSHGREDEKFIRKQGLNRVFVECDQHMWRLGERELPKGITVNGGSDWFALNREFCTYAIEGKDRLLKDLKYWYRYTLLPAESFFHTLAQNSDKCETFVDNNLRVTNWNRARGCKCQYKHIVDWCGCSPNDFYPNDLVRLQTSRPVFFARKFEEIVNQEVVNHLDFKLYGEYPSGTPGLTSYWENYYDHLDGPTSVSDAHLTHYTSFARMGLKDLNDQLGYYDNDDETCGLRVGEIYQVEVYKRSEEFAGYLVTLGASWKTGSSITRSNESEVSLQVLVSHLPTFRIVDKESLLANRIKTAMVGTNWDVKELLLRDWGGIIGPNSDPRLVARWRKGSEDFVVTVVVIDPLNIVADYNDFRTPTKAAGVTDTPLNLRKPMRPGRWTIRFYVQRQYNNICAEVDFYVSPLQFDKGAEDTKQLSVYNRGVEADGQVNSASRSLYSIRTTLNLAKNMEAFQNLVANSFHTAGRELKSWIDSVVGSVWKTKDVCFVSESTGSWKSKQPGRCARQRQITPNLCVNMNWSSFSPDPKSELGPVKSNGRLR